MRQTGCLHSGPLPCEHDQWRHHLNEQLATVEHLLFGICTFPSTSHLLEPWTLTMLLCQHALVHACSRRKPSSLCKIPYSMLGLRICRHLSVFYAFIWWQSSTNGLFFFFFPRKWACFMSHLSYVIKKISCSSFWPGLKVSSFHYQFAEPPTATLYSFSVNF